MTEADFEREAIKLFRQLGLTVDAETLDFFQGQSVSLIDWKSSFKPKRVRIPEPYPPRGGKPCNMSTTSSSSSSPHQRKRLPLTVVRPNSDIGSEGSVSASPTESIEIYKDEDHEDFGPCAMCDLPVVGVETGCFALEQIFHNTCFKCNKCYKMLSGGSFFVKNGLILCERDYLLSLDKCFTCQQVITDKIIRAVGRTYHPVCFRCSQCGMCLDGIPFAKDFNDRVYCEKDFHKMFAPRCASCQHPIVPLQGNKKSIRIIALNSSFHLECYRCSECDIPLISNDGSDGPPQCYPIADHPLCLNCNKLWTTRGQRSLIVKPVVS
ncbi:PREDICTED: Wilms tumor protein 1-interacting protein homolog [Amphimedon queenslandica]|uniref:LIM zinc-binding domain-containing protein n=1 Tax=Amphimedon queenslandica TaxID=400682 RepID=A0A1X7VPZ5_AMPQE|nr:PREDICTED: Wilms tumor protein 1-interacting protein homolog [Amphimedon queenslandica]|eukprot:XP_011409674.1 PREDICTED: Wilms tumor protein 1-interacting protein homolog [Amphimedon queenslandica]